jgi:pimeloyl-ACP methyl ester carboxylesterase
LWGEEDPTFPLQRALDMAKQFEPAAQIVVIAGAKLLPHEDQPARVLASLKPYLKSM